MPQIQKIINILLLPILLGWTTISQAQDEPLMPDDAFAFSAKVIDANTVRAEWNVADKYYLFRDKISFSTDTPEISLGQVELPAGKLKHGIKPDGTEGDVETLMHTVTIDIPLNRNNPALNNFTQIGRAHV